MIAVSQGWMEWMTYRGGWPPICDPHDLPRVKGSEDCPSYRYGSVKRGSELPMLGAASISPLFSIDRLQPGVRGENTGPGGGMRGAGGAH